MRFMATFFALLPAIAQAAPTPQDGDVSCGRDSYTSDEIQAAADAACQYLSEGTTAGGSKYPESYQDREGFSFDGVSGPFYEFPVLASGRVYSGGSPGADRVVINDQCELAGEITHDGASGNNFVGCSGTNKRK